MRATDGGPRRAFVALSRANLRALPPGYRERLREAWPGPVDLLYEGREERRLPGLARAVARAGSYGAMVFDGSVGLRGGYLDLLAAAAAHRRDHLAVVIGDCTWKAGTSRADRLTMRAGIRLVDGPGVTYCVLSHDEVAIFPRTWGVDGERVACVQWPYILREDELGAASETGGVFAGGDSLRDFSPLIEAARSLAAPVTIATRRQDVLARTDAPPNVAIAPLSHEEYIARLRAAAIVVVPLVPTVERSAGQTTYVNALAMGKLVVVTDCLGVRDYIESGVTGLVVPPGDAVGLRESLQWALDPANAAEVDRIRSNARASAQARFRPDDYVANLLRVAAATRERIASSR
jgi:glycosyltransferase involved in cell wall biosynthesis